MKLAPLTTFLVVTCSLTSAAPTAAADPRIPTWNSAAAGSSRAPAPHPAQLDIIPPHASGPGKPAYVDFCNNPNVIKNAPCKPSREAEAKAALRFAYQAGLPDKRDATEPDALEKREMPLILADPGRPLHQNVRHEINRAQHQAEKNLDFAKREIKNLPKLEPQPVYDAEGNSYLNGVMVKDTANTKREALKPQPVFDMQGNTYINGVMIKAANTKREVKNLPKLEPAPVYDAEGNAYLNGVMVKDDTNTKRETKNPSPVFDMQGNTYINGVMVKAVTNIKREVKNLPKLEPAPVNDAQGNAYLNGVMLPSDSNTKRVAKKPSPVFDKLPKAPEAVPTGSKPTSANPPAKPVNMAAIIPAKKGPNPPGKGKPTYQEWVETYGYEGLPSKRDAAVGDVPTHPGLDKRQACPPTRTSSGGLARLHEVLTANHLPEVEAALKEHRHGDCILAVEESKETSISQDGAVSTKITTQTNAIEPAAVAVDNTKANFEDDVPGNQNASHGLAPLVEQQEAHQEHDPTFHHAAPADYAAAVDHGEQRSHLTV